MTTYTQELARIAGSIDVHGIAANETAVAMMVERARNAGVNPVLLAVLSDVTEPEVARARAFGKIATTLGAAVSDTQPREHGKHPAMVVA